MFWKVNRCDTILAKQSAAEDVSVLGYWWVVVTMTTVGYGDYYPKNGVGYIAAAGVMMLGLMITALPIAIIGTNFSIYYDYNKKRMKQRKKKATKQLEKQTSIEMKDRKLLENTNSKREEVILKLHST